MKPKGALHLVVLLHTWAGGCGYDEKQTCKQKRRTSRFCFWWLGRSGGGFKEFEEVFGFAKCSPFIEEPTLWDRLSLSSEFAEGGFSDELCQEGESRNLFADLGVVFGGSVLSGIQSVIVMNKSRPPCIE